MRLREFRMKTVVLALLCRCVSPDVEVPLDPIAVNADTDPQLDAAIAQVLKQLKTAKPAFPTQVGQ
jgi:hypothetical protein